MCLPKAPDIPEIEAPAPLPEVAALPTPEPTPAAPVMAPPAPPGPQTAAPALPPIPVAPAQAPPPQMAGGDVDDAGKVKTLKSKRAQLQQQRKGSGTRIKKKKKTDQLAIEQGGLGGQAVQTGSAPTVNIQK